jgi:hypothetical protein
MLLDIPQLRLFSQSFYINIFDIFSLKIWENKPNLRIEKPKNSKNSPFFGWKMKPKNSPKKINDQNLLI